MDLRILEIASNTENNKVLDNFTHQSKNKNQICGDEMEISLIVKNDKVIDMGYQCKSCIYCQASVSLLSQKIKNKNIQEIKNFVISCENKFENTIKENSTSNEVRLSQKSIKKKIFNPQPYRIILRLSGANPSAPAETVTRALRKAGVEFEVEKIERFDENNLSKGTSLKR